MLKSDPRVWFVYVLLAMPCAITATEDGCEGLAKFGTVPSRVETVDAASAAHLTSFPGKLYQFYTQSPDKAEAKARALIDGFRKSGRSLWPTTLPRDKSISLRDYFHAVMAEKNNSTHYARTLRNYWMGTRQLFEIGVAEAHDLQVFYQSVEDSAVFEIMARKHGLSDIQLFGSAEASPFK